MALSKPSGYLLRSLVRASVSKLARFRMLELSLVVVYADGAVFVDVDVLPVALGGTLRDGRGSGRSTTLLAEEFCDMDAVVLWLGGFMGNGAVLEVERSDGADAAARAR